MVSPETPLLGEQRPATGASLDRAALEALIARNYTGLRLLVMRRMRDRAAAEDLLQEAIRTTWEKWQAGAIARPDQIGGYIFQVAMNLLRNFRRSAAERGDRRAQAGALDALPDDVAATDRWLEKKIALRVKHLLHSMPNARDRDVLKRFYLDEEDKASICRELLLEPEQFDKILHRARTRLRTLLESQGLKRSDFFMLCLI